MQLKPFPKALYDYASMGYERNQVVMIGGTKSEAKEHWRKRKF